jgi:hypothetical protein
MSYQFKNYYVGSNNKQASMSQTLPKELRFMPGQVMAQSRNFLFKQAADSTTYSAGQTVTINLPKLPRCYLNNKDSYIKLKLTPNCYKTDGSTRPTTTNLNPLGIYGLISRIDVYSYRNSTLLESIDQANVLTQLLMDLHASDSDLLNHFSVTSGTNTALLGEAVTNATATEYSFIPLSFLGSLGSRYAPLVNGYTVVLTLCTGDELFSTDTVAGTDTRSYTISNLEYCMNVVELSPEADALLMSSVGNQPLIVPSKSYRHFVANQTDDNTSLSINIGLAASSLTNVLFCQRPTVYWTNSSWQIPSQRSKNGLYSWTLQIGANSYPSTAGCIGDIDQFTELLRSRHELGADHLPTCFTRANYIITASGVTGSTARTTRGLNAHGYDLESVPGKSDLLQGLDVTGQSISLNIANAGTVKNSRIDIWCEINQFVNIIPNVSTTVSF